MAQRIVSQVETTCDICDKTIYGDVHPQKGFEQISVNGKYLTVGVNLNVFEYHKCADHICPECLKEILKQLADTWH